MKLITRRLAETGPNCASQVVVKKVRAARDQQAVTDSLQALRNGAADESVNTMPLIIDCVKAYASVGEIS